MPVGNDCLESVPILRAKSSRARAHLRKVSHHSRAIRLTPKMRRILRT